MNSTELEKKRRRKRRIANVDMDDDDEGLNDDFDMRQGDNDLDSVDSKSGKRAGKRKLKESNKNEPIPSKLYKQMQTLLDFVIKYRDK